MSICKPDKHREEDSRSSEGVGEGDLLDEEGFYSYREEESASFHQTWSPLEDLDDSGHFTASPDGETVLSGSSRSHSPCCTEANLSSQMHQQDSSRIGCTPNANTFKFYQQQVLQPNKPLIAPRSVMTVKGCQTHNTSSSYFPPESNLDLVNGISQNSENSPPTLTFLPDMEEYTNGSEARKFLSRNSGHESEDGENCGESSGYLRGILDNFNSLYMEKLKMLDDLVAEGDDEQRMLLMEKKTNMLETWAKDVCVQNMVLVHTVEELEREANRKVSALQKKIAESTQAAKEHMTMIKKYEEQVKLLLKNHNETEEKNLVLKIDLEKLRNECKRVKDRMNYLLKDNESLITLVCRIRDMGVWDVNGLELQRSSFEQIFGLYPNLLGAEVQTVFSKEKMKQAQETEEKMSQLERQLANVQKTQRETESHIAYKDSKIEELETEIKNLSNRAQYCEQECNDYKKSLLETQEKLLEATRRLNASPKFARQPVVPGVSEMTELIKELRDVKSQLNTAVEEKLTAKEESNYFKRELSDRLREMHDIQNMFQSLATEVVSSRVAFQQVQEKEVQLQSLKSEVQTYQSRCADAEDLIRKKEKEIKLLQQQMNEIHKRSKKPSSPSLSNSLQSISKNGAGGDTLRFHENSYKNVSSPTKIPVRKAVNKPTRFRSQEPTKNFTIPRPTGISQSNHEGGRPMWNKNFRKSSGTLAPSDPQFPQASKWSGSNLTSSQDFLKINSQFEQTEECFDNLSQSCKEVYTNKSYQVLSELDGGLSSEQVLCSSLANRSTLKSTQAMESLVNLFKSPKNQKKVDDETKEKLINTRDPPTDATTRNIKKLPVVTETFTGISKRKGPSKSKKLDNPLLKPLLKNPHATTTPRLNELISAVVETSRQLLGSDAKELPITQKNKDIKSLTITASHYRKKPKPVNKQQKTMEARKVKSSEEIAETNRGASAEAHPKIPTKFHSSTGIGCQIEEKEEPLQKVAHKLPENVQEFLAGLPQASHDDLVKNWIKKSTSNTVGKGSTINEKSNKGNNKPKTIVSGRRPSVKVMKHLATRRWPKQRSRGSVDQAEDLNAQMFELEDEWGKVFANIECNVNGVVTGKGKVGKDVGATASPSLLQPPAPPSNPSNSSEKSPMHSALSACSDRKCYQGQQQEPMQELLDRLGREKKEMEERFSKELQDRDIELKMQKVTIQHLQDAYVALKRGQPIPVPQHATGNKIVLNGASTSTNGHHHNSVLDV